jgi:serine/threonine protein kinase
MIHTNHFSYDKDYDPPEYGEGKATTHSTHTDTWRQVRTLILFTDCISLGLLLWQILEAKPLPPIREPTNLLKTLEKESHRIRSIIQECLNTTPSKRPQAGDVASRLLDEYNDSCAGKTPRDELISAVISRSRQLVADRRLNRSSSPKPKEKIEKSDIEVLMDLRNSWDESGSGFRLAPEASFLVGAGIFWDLMDVNDVQVSSNVVSRGFESKDGIHESRGNLIC